MEDAMQEARKNKMFKVWYHWTRIKLTLSGWFYRMAEWLAD